MRLPIISANRLKKYSVNNFEIGATVDHEHYGNGEIVAEQDLFWTIDFGPRGVIEVSKRKADMLTLLKSVNEKSHSNTNNYTMEELEKTLRRILEEYTGGGDIELGGKWQGGTLIMEPGDTSLKSKEVPIETFFHKIVMLRDRLRVMEQKINAHPKFSDEEKIEMQQYITKIYGSLTTFNVLFQDKDDYFVGEKTT